VDNPGGRDVVRFVEMFHPESGGIATVPTSAVPHHLTLGWCPNDVPDASSDVTTDETHEENS
jgi:hypothetical protein